MEASKHMGAGEGKEPKARTGRMSAVPTVLWAQARGKEPIVCRKPCVMILISCSQLCLPASSLPGSVLEVRRLDREKFAAVLASLHPFIHPVDIYWVPSLGIHVVTKEKGMVLRWCACMPLAVTLARAHGRERTGFRTGRQGLKFYLCH